MDINKFYVVPIRVINSVLDATFNGTTIILYETNESNINGNTKLFTVVVSDNRTTLGLRVSLSEELQRELSQLNPRVVENNLFGKRITYNSHGPAITDNITAVDYLSYYSSYLRQYIDSRNIRNELSSRTMSSFNAIFTSTPSIYGTSGQITEKKPIDSKTQVIESIDLKTIFKYIPIKYNYCYGFYDYTNNNLVLLDDVMGAKVNIVSKDTNFEYYKRFNTFSLYKNCKFKVKGYERSSELFKFTNIKKELVNKEVEVSNLEIQVTVKRSKKLENTICVKFNDRNYRFVLEDIEIIYPNISGYQPKKNRTINKNDLVRVINDKHIVHLKKNDKVKVYDIKQIGNKKYVGFKKDSKIVYAKINKFKKI